MRVCRPALLLGLLAAAAASGCTGGQSGTETPVPVREDVPQPDAGDTTITTFAAGPCACALANRSALLRAELLELDACWVRARVQEQLGVSAELELELAPGTELQTRRTSGLGCGEGLTLAPGDPILLVYSPADAEFGSESSALVATWGSEHVFGMGDDRPIALPDDERERLLESAACTSWFDAHPDAAGPSSTPPPDPQPCE